MCRRGQAVGRLGEQTQAQADRHAAEFAVHGLHRRSQPALFLSLAERLVGGAPVAEQGIGDQMNEEGKVDGVLEGPAAVALEDAGQEVGLGDIIQKAESGVGERQAATSLQIKSSGHRGSSRPRLRQKMPDNYLMPANRV